MAKHSDNRCPANPNWDETRRRLARRCKTMLEANKLRSNTITGRKFIHVFFVGALCALDYETQPWVTICLLTGRHDDLLKED